MGCDFSSPAAPPAPTSKHPETIANVSSADARLDFAAEIVGHNRRLLDEYDVGKQIGKCANAGVIYLCKYLRTACHGFCVCDFRGCAGVTMVSCLRACKSRLAGASP